MGPSSVLHAVVIVMPLLHTVPNLSQQKHCSGLLKWGAGICMTLEAILHAWKCSWPDQTCDYDYMNLTAYKLLFTQWNVSVNIYSFFLFQTKSNNIHSVTADRVMEYRGEHTCPLAGWWHGYALSNEKLINPTCQPNPAQPCIKRSLVNLATPIAALSLPWNPDWRCSVILDDIRRWAKWAIYSCNTHRVRLISTVTLLTKHQVSLVGCFIISSSLTR